MSETNPFALLGLPLRFDVDARALRSAWMRRAAEVHPDTDGSLDPSLDPSIALNEAYRALSDPSTRARVMLRLLGAPDVDERALPEGFLFEMVALRERVDEAGGDTTVLSGLRNEAENRRREAYATVAAAFTEVNGSGPISAEATQRVVTALNVARSFDRVLEQLDREAGLRED